MSRFRSRPHNYVHMHQELTRRIKTFFIYHAHFLGNLQKDVSVVITFCLR